MEKHSVLLLTSVLGLDALAQVMDPELLEDMIGYALLTDDHYDSGVYVIEMLPESRITHEEMVREFVVESPMPFYRQIEHNSSGRRSDVLRTSGRMPRGQVGQSKIVLY